MIVNLGIKDLGGSLLVFPFWPVYYVLKRSPFSPTHYFGVNPPFPAEIPGNGGGFSDHPPDSGGASRMKGKALGPLSENHRAGGKTSTIQPSLLCIALDVLYIELARGQAGSLSLTPRITSGSLCRKGSLRYLQQCGLSGSEVYSSDGGALCLDPSVVAQKSPAIGRLSVGPALC